jgi:capsular polysaccharide transport system ATP-binding protein
MIDFRGVSKSYRAAGGRKLILDDLSLTLPAGARVALMGRNGAGKSTLLGLIAGTVPADGGRIVRQGSMSWPLGFAGSFANDLTGIQNTRFAARVYGADTDALVDYVTAFSELGPFMRMPVRTYSAGMRARLAFGLSMGLGFDWYLVDEITAVGDAAFRTKSLEVFRERLGSAGLLMVSHSVPMLRSFCTAGLVLEAGTARYYDDVDDAIAVHEAAMV